MTYLSKIDKLEELAGTPWEIDVLERRQRFLVAALRANDIPWERIGLALGTSRQAAQQKYQKSSDSLSRTEQWHCDCGWSIAYPAFEITEANEDIANHQLEHAGEPTESRPE